MMIIDLIKKLESIKNTEGSNICVFIENKEGEGSDFEIKLTSFKKDIKFLTFKVRKDLRV